ncbi:aldo/keto reductase [Levilactobacillus acidifarinae]|nr:aldo/keto reductase [Levilactobacillus acidifarinae]GEO68197.1 oxidoreductase [Levilactobacillus acidifarinae]
METVTLNNGTKMPLVGFGVFEIKKSECKQVVLNALKAGYRLIDTAQAYDNEEEVGMALQETDVPREDIFLTTKVWVTEHSYNKARASILESMKKLKTNYLDLVLIHQPLGDYYSAYHAMEDLYKEGKIKAIGISNFSAERMADITAFNEIKPVINQVETHLFFQQNFLHQWMNKIGIQHEAWGPLSQRRIVEIMKNHDVKEIADKHHKTPVQIALRFNIQRGIVVIPKSMKLERMKENIDIFDFALTEEEMNTIRKLDENKSMWAGYDNPEIVQMAMS